MATPTFEVEIVSLTIKRSTTTTVQFEGAAVVVTNYVTGRSISCNLRGLELIASLDCWTAFQDLTKLHPAFSPQSLLAAIVSLIDADVLLVQGSDEANLDREFELQWEWGVTAGLFHFGITHFPWATQEQTAAFISDRAAKERSPALFVEHQPNGRLNLPKMPASDLFYEVLAQRVSARQFDGGSISLEALTNCLYSGCGIVSTLDAGELGVLPFKWAPSGGARNPFEAYVYALRVEGLDTGLYHYSGRTHSLIRHHRDELPAAGTLLANQDNLDECAALIILVAQFRRTMWKYPNPTGYRVLLIEAGHVAQNILLAATREGLGSLPTCAMNDVEVRAFLGLSRIQQAPIHCVVLGRPYLRSAINSGSELRAQS